MLISIGYKRINRNYMREPNKNHVYSLEELTSEERKILAIECSNAYLLDEDTEVLHFDDEKWVVSNFENEEYVNAKELFYTLENIQVDADELDKDMFRDVVKIYNNNNFVFDDYKDESLNYLSSVDNKLIFSRHRDKKNTITYEKFMELFAPQYEVKYIAEQPKEDKPKHYANGIDTFERMESNCTVDECLAFAKGNIDKYNFRKKGQDLEDYTKIISYANWAIKLLNKK